MAEEEQNPLISTQKSSGSGLQVALHPLVLLTISDYITRHTLRQQKGPVVGALLGQQNGREITIEHAFECLLTEVNDEVILSQAWFEDRLQQMKDVHKIPPLDLVGWYTPLPTTGPQYVHLPIHRQILASYNESAILLGFHPTTVLSGSTGGKLPLTIYESNYEADDTTTEPSSSEDKEMKDGEPLLKLKFKEVPYTVETGEAEMISVDFVARGGGNATAVVTEGTTKGPSSTSTALTPIDGNKKGKKKAEERKFEKTDDQNTLSREEEELITSLTAKANAIKMLYARINLIATYLQSLPPAYISDKIPESIESEESEGSKNNYAPINHEILRSIQALLSRLSVLIPADKKGFEHELVSEQNDVGLVGLLSEITRSVREAREVGRKFHVVDGGKNRKGGSDRGEGGKAGPWLDFAASGGGMGGGSSSFGGAELVTGVGDLLA